MLRVHRLASRVLFSLNILLSCNEKMKDIQPGNLQEMRMKQEDVIDVLRGCRYGGEIAIAVLTEKCLIKIREDETIWIHDQIRDMGRQIVVEENLVDPGMRSRLWDRYEILAVLRNLKVRILN
ncbi:hypothetical protein K1719_002677 [Acacia pycnantha]|nr:hypothetical protein K1719_002677 [Acacia pycnantha]